MELADALKRPMGVNSRLVGRAATLLLIGLLVAACGSADGEHGRAGTTSVARMVASPAQGITGRGWQLLRGRSLRSAIVINSQIGQTFVPPPAWAKPKLNGVQAWDDSFLGAHRNKPRPIPADLSYQLGMLTVPPSVTDVLAWGFSSPPGPCAPVIGGLPRPGHTWPTSSPSAPKRCIAWTFINAENASNPDDTWQPLGTPSPTSTPTPGAVIALRPGGFLDASLERFSPQQLVLQGPLSTIRWAFDDANCSIDLYWFWPPQLQRGPGRAACPWRHIFSVEVIADFISRGHVFTVIGGYVAHQEGQLVRAILTNGQTQIYDPESADGAWLFAVQRCGDYPGTAFRAVQEISRTGTIIASLPVPSAPRPTGEAGCKS